MYALSIPLFLIAAQTAHVDAYLRLKAQPGVEPMDLYIACLNASGDYRKDSRAPRAVACEDEFRERAKAKHSAERAEQRKEDQPLPARQRPARQEPAPAEPPPTRQRPAREVPAPAEPTPNQVVAYRFALFDECSDQVATVTPISDQRDCYEVGAHLYYCFLGPAKDYCEREYRETPSICRGCRENPNLLEYVSRKLSDLGWKGFLGPRFRAVR